MANFLDQNSQSGKIISDDAYSSSWNGDTNAPSKNAVYDKIETLPQNGAVVTLTGAESLSNKTLTSPVINGTITGDAFLDEDDMTSNSATKLASQQSIKAYVDAQLATGYRLIEVTKHTIAVDLGNGAGQFMVDANLNGLNLSGVLAKVATAGTGGGPMLIQIYNVTQAADMLTTRINIDASETSSADASTQAVIDTANDDVATGDILRIDIDQVFTTTLARGLQLILTFS